jgi:hypothetical protein
MKRTAARLIAALVLLAPATLVAGDMPPRYVVFIHAGPKSPDDPAVRQIAGILVKSGFVVRAPEGDSDVVGGPGIDYFSDDALPAAKQLAELLNNLLPKLISGVPVKPLSPRKQNVKNPATYLGAWLFETPLPARAPTVAPVSPAPAPRG